MKLLLTSQGLCNRKIRSALVKLVGKKAKDIRILAVSLKLTKAKTVKHVKRLKKEFSKSKIKHYTITHLKKKYSYNDIEDFDVIYMCGGNSFHYLDTIRKTGFDRLIKRFVKENKVYLGASAGAALACPNIDYVSWSKYVYDENIEDLKNLKALNFIDYLIMPHFDKRVAKEMPQFRKRARYKFITLTNSQGIIFTRRDDYKRI